MPINNTVFLTGRITGYPFFNRVPAGDRGTLPFVQFLIEVPRGEAQSGDFPSDPIRVVLYGALAEQYFPFLVPDMPIAVQGWLQYRNANGHGSLLEVVAQSLTVVRVPDGLPAPRNNQVLLRGTVDREPFFNRVPAPFLLFYLSVSRDQSQPVEFPKDKVRVVLYGDSAHLYYPALRKRGTVVAIQGWLQYRNAAVYGPLLEVVACELALGRNLRPEPHTLAGGH